MDGDSGPQAPLAMGAATFRKLGHRLVDQFAKFFYMPHNLRAELRESEVELRLDVLNRELVDRLQRGSETFECSRQTDSGKSLAGSSRIRFLAKNWLYIDDWCQVWCWVREGGSVVCRGCQEYITGQR